MCKERPTFLCYLVLSIEEISGEKEKRERWLCQKSFLVPILSLEKTKVLWTHFRSRSFYVQKHSNNLGKIASVEIVPTQMEDIFFYFKVKFLTVKQKNLRKHCSNHKLFSFNPKSIKIFKIFLEKQFLICLYFKGKKHVFFFILKLSLNQLFFKNLVQANNFYDNYSILDSRQFFVHK